MMPMISVGCTGHAWSGCFQFQSSLAIIEPQKAPLNINIACSMQFSWVCVQVKKPGSRAASVTEDRTTAEITGNATLGLTYAIQPDLCPVAYALLPVVTRRLLRVYAETLLTGIPPFPASCLNTYLEWVISLSDWERLIFTTHH